MNKLLFLMMFAAGLGAALYVSSRNNPGKPVDDWQNVKGFGFADASVRSAWPPVLNEKFPAVRFVDHDGQEFAMSDLEGKPTLVEYIAMTCAGCQALSGGNKYGAFGGQPCQQGLGSIDEYFEQYTNHKLDRSRINFVQVIVYDTRMKEPEPNDLADWRNHFQLDRENTYVVSGGDALISRTTHAMIPGFQLLDEDGTLLFDSCGHNPRHDLYRELLPAAKDLLK